jgi:two-component system NarL family response regulator
MTDDLTGLRLTVPDGVTLSGRQLQLLGLIAAGMATEEAAAQMGVSCETARTHLKRTIGRLGARNRTHAVAMALRAGLID